MDITLLVESIAGLIVILSILIFLWLLSPKKKVKKTKIKKEPSKSYSDNSLEALVAIVKDKTISETKLKETLDKILKHHGKIHKKMGLRSHPDLNIYVDLLVAICRHPNTNKHIIIDFDKQLQKLNPQYKSTLNDAVTKGLNSRGI